MGIYARHLGEWYNVYEGGKVGGLEGLGGWATITGVSGDYTPHRYNDGPNGVGGTDWVAYEFTDDGTITTSGGLVDALIVGAGTGEGSASYRGSGCIPWYGLLSIAESETIVVGKGRQYGGGHSSLLGQTHNGVSHIEPGSTAVGTGAGWVHAVTTGKEADRSKGIVLNYTGDPIEYAMGRTRRLDLGLGPVDKATPGSGGAENVNLAYIPANGTVIVRVPKAYADNVQETFHAWNNYASVENGVVVETQKLPDNQPRTLSNEWVDAPAEVSVGWIYDGSEFVPPAPPSNEELIAELEARVEELRKA